ncbi:M56 family metallopeptidase [Bacillus sp. ST24]|uniref:M56 family metallopeptidase n=1 Tax=Bacillus sp. ST24 TaxID=2978740 RepID=UPI0021D4186D|nr:transcriptional regulator [Bacillus sp. ST24]
MNSLLHNTYLPVAFDWVIETSIMASILVGFILSIKVLLKNKLTPRWHYALWLILIIRLILPWSPDSSFSIYSMLSREYEHTRLSIQSTKEVIEPKEQLLEHNKIKEENISNEKKGVSNKEDVHLDVSMYDIFLGIWLLGIIGLTTTMFILNRHLNHYITKQPNITDKKVIRIFENCKEKMSIKRPIPLIQAGKISSPTLLGVKTPRILLSNKHIQQLDENQLRYIFYHELTHFKRKDIKINWLMYSLVIVNWFNPIIWYAYYAMREDQEIACDAYALTYIGSEEKLAYGHTILTLLEHYSTFYQVPNLANLSRNKNTIKRRIIMIKNFNKKSYRWSALGIAAIVGVSAFSLVNVKAEEPSYKQEIPKEESMKQENSKQVLTPVLENQDVKLNGLVTEDIRNSLKTGEGAIPLNQKITDQGITIHLKNLIVNGSKIIGHYTIEKKDGTLVPYEFNTKGLDLYEDGKENGVQVREPIYKLPGYQVIKDDTGKIASGPTSTLLFLDGGTNHSAFSLLDSNGKELNLPTAGYDKPDGLFAFVNKEHSPNIRLQINIERIGKIKGNWKKQFLINVEKGIVQTEENKENTDSYAKEQKNKEMNRKLEKNIEGVLQPEFLVHKLTDQQRKSLQDRGLPIKQTRDEFKKSELILVSSIKPVSNGDGTFYLPPVTGNVDIIKKDEYKEKYGKDSYISFGIWE